MSSDPYCLAVGSHKGGTGRTAPSPWRLALATGAATACASLLVDADPAAAAGLVALDESGACSWPKVQYRAGFPKPGEATLEADVVIIDCPPLLDPTALPVVRLRADAGVILTCVADPLSLRATVPAAAAVLSAARNVNPRIEPARRAHRPVYGPGCCAAADA